MRSAPLSLSPRARRLCVRAVPMAALALATGIGAGHADAATFGWASKATTSTRGAVTGVASLPDGSSIVTGSFQGTATFGSTVLTNPTVATDDVFIARVNPDGTYAWATRAGGVGNDNSGTVAVLSDGTSVITGTFTGPASFGSTSLTSTGLTDAFVAKLAPDGSFTWATKVGSTVGANGQDVAVLTDGSAIFGGSFFGTGAFGAAPDLTSAGSADVFVAKVDTNGAFTWASRAGSSFWDGADAVSVLSDGTSMLAGSFHGTNAAQAAFGSTSLISAGGYDVFVSKMAANGTFAWTVRAGGTSDDDAYGLATRSDGSSIVAGSFYGPANFGTTTLNSAGSLDVFVAQVDPFATITSAVAAGGTGDEYGFDVAALPDGAAVVTGSFEGTNVNPATFGSTSLVSAGLDDAFVAKVATDGTFSQVTRAGGTGSDAGLGVDLRADGSSAIAGSFQNTAAFAFAPDLTAAGTKDGWVAWFVPGPRAPQVPTAVAGTEQATVTITPLADLSVTSYTVTAQPGGATCTVTVPAVGCTVPGLSGGTAYTFAATATNAEGTSPASPRSTVVTPDSAPAAPASPAAAPAAGPGASAGQQATATSALSAGLRASRRTVRSGRRLVLTLGVTNGGPAAVESVRACIKLPAGLVVARASGATAKGGAVCSSPTTLASGATIAHVVTVRATGARRTQRSVTGWATASGAPRAESVPLTVGIRPR